jgi:nucleoside-diphosphate kinase
MPEITLSIIKPDAVHARHTGKIIAMMEERGLTIRAMKMLTLSKQQASAFYAVHSARPFYNDLVSFMSSGPVVALALSGDHAIADYRALMGATNPAQAAEGTIRKAFAKSIDENAVHGSDGLDTAAIEVAFFFSPEEIH